MKKYIPVLAILALSVSLALNLSLGTPIVTAQAPTPTYILYSLTDVAPMPTVATPVPGVTALASPTAIVSDEDRRIVDAAFTNLSEADSYSANFSLLFTFDYAGQQGELALDGVARLTGLTATGSEIGFDVTLDGRFGDGITENIFNLEMRYVGGGAYFRVFADNGVGETQTPWLYTNIQDMANQIYEGTSLSFSPDSPSFEGDFPLPPIEDFFGAFDFGKYISNTRLPDDGGVARFERNIDLVGIAGSEELGELLQLAGSIDPSAQIDEATLELIRQQAPLLLTALFPELVLRFTQFVNLSDESLNRLAINLDMMLDMNLVGQMSGQPATDVPPLLIDLDIEISFSNFGVPVNIETPEDFVPLEEYVVVPLPTREP